MALLDRDCVLLMRMEWWEENGIVIFIKGNVCFIGRNKELEGGFIAYKACNSHKNRDYL